MDNFVAQARAVDAGRGWTWIAEAWKLFMRQPGTWIGLFIVFAVIFIVLALIPVLGAIATFVLTPVFVGGMVIGCRAMTQGGALEIGHLFAGFRQRSGVLVTVGLLYFAASFVIALIAGGITGVSLISMDPAALAAAAMSVLLAVLIMLALLIPVLMALWFAPALVVLHEQGAVQAIKGSFFGCLKNIWPFLLYGVVLLVLGIIACIPLGLGWLVLGPVMFASVYTAYRDIFFG